MTFAGKSLVFSLVLCLHVWAQSPASIDPAKAAAAFAEAEKLSAKDDGKLWGAALYGPMLFATHAVRSARRMTGWKSGDDRQVR
jgi:hypothetical protein